ncbi:MAG: energy transducer TonB [bacterium]|nr:energy transducer TonB [bacterium]
MPIETESEDVPEDVTIETTDLDLDQAPVDIPPPPEAFAAGAFPEEEEILEFWKVEQKPRLVKQVSPNYPDAARKRGIEGSVYLMVLVGKDGRVQDVRVIKGEKIFENAAMQAAYQFVFEPALQNDKPVKVWMTIPVQFKLVGI